MLVSVKWFLLLHLLIGWSTENTASADTLKSVQILFRHGNRERDAGYGNPSGHLKPDGKKQMYDLGLFFRQRYNGLLKTNYDQSEISILSSDVDRIIQCASLVAYGLYKDFNMAANWDGEGKLQYEPIPVRTIPKKYDKYIQIFPDCPRQPEIEDESAQTYFDRFLQENQDLIEYYYNSTGDETILDSSQGRIEQFTEMMFKSDQLSMNVTNNLPIVEWAEPLQNNFAFLSVKTGFLREGVNTLEKKRLNAGPLMQLLISNMEEPDETRKKMHLFSGHDRILIFLLGALGIDNPQVPDMRQTGNSLMIELHEDPATGAGPYVQFLFRNGTQHEPYVLEMPNCGSPCYLATFKKVTKELIPTDLEFETECAAVGINSNLKAQSLGPLVNQLNITFFSTLIILLTIVKVFQFILIKRRTHTCSR